MKIILTNYVGGVRIGIFNRPSQLLRAPFRGVMYLTGMITTGHLLIGGALGATATAVLPSPAAGPVALGLGILSHHLLDLLPHTDAATFWPDPR
jgi:hypothetical protein